MNNDQLVDRIKHYWNTQPCNVKHSLAEPGTEQYWNEISERRYFVEPHLRDLAGFHQWRGKRVLEVGSGINKRYWRRKYRKRQSNHSWDTHTNQI